MQNSVLLLGVKLLFVLLFVRLLGACSLCVGCYELPATRSKAHDHPLCASSWISWIRCYCCFLLLRNKNNSSAYNGSERGVD